MLLNKAHRAVFENLWNLIEDPIDIAWYENDGCHDQ